MARYSTAPWSAHHHCRIQRIKTYARRDNLRLPGQLVITVVYKACPTRIKTYARRDYDLLIPVAKVGRGGDSPSRFIMTR